MSETRPRVRGGDSADRPSASPVEVADRQHLLPIDCGAVVRLVHHVLALEGARGAVEVAFVDDETIAELHERFLGVPGPTDVITFPDGDESGAVGEVPLSLGEIVVSTDTAARQAPEWGIDPLEEAYLYVVHGVLHLLGWDDADEADAERMAARQREILDGFLGG